MVTSRRNLSRRYLVDLAANWGAGQCECPDFGFNRAPRITEGNEHDDKAECWHIKQARRYWAIQTVLATAPDDWLEEGCLVDEPPERVIPAHEVDTASVF